MSLSTKTLLHPTISISAQTQHTQPSSSLSLPLTATARGHFPGGSRFFATTPGTRTRPSLWSSNTTPASTTRIYSLVPMVIDASSTGERAYDIFSRLLKERIVYINGPIDEYMAQIKVAELLHLEAENPNRPIYMYINSPGGEVVAGLAIYDTMQFIRAPVRTICLGQAASMGSLLLTAGAPGQRSALPNSTIMIHQPSGGYRGQAADMMIHTKEIMRVYDKLNQLYVKHTGQPLEVVQKNMDRDFFMTAEEAKEFGLIDEVIDRRKTPLVTEAAGSNGSSAASGPQSRFSGPDQEVQAL